MWRSMQRTAYTSVCVCVLKGDEACHFNTTRHSAISTASRRSRVGRCWYVGSLWIDNFDVSLWNIAKIINELSPVGRLRWVQQFGDSYFDYSSSAGIELESKQRRSIFSGRDKKAWEAGLFWHDQQCVFRKAIFASLAVVCDSRWPISSEWIFSLDRNVKIKTGLYLFKTSIAMWPA